MHNVSDLRHEYIFSSYDKDVEQHRVHRTLWRKLFHIVLPEKYIIRRWTKNAMDGIAQDFNSPKIQADGYSDIANRYEYLCHIFVKLVARAGECEEAFKVAVQITNELRVKILKIFSRKGTACIREVMMLIFINLLQILTKEVKNMILWLKKKEVCKGKLRYRNSVKKKI